MTGQDRRNQESILMLLIIPAFLLGATFLYFIGQYALIGRNPFQFFADSNTYHDIYAGFRKTPAGFIDVSYNFLGPLLILTLLGGTIYLVLAFNIVVFVLSTIYICRMLGLNPIRAAAVQFLSPLTASSLLSVNKEILIFPVLALLIAAYRSRSIWLVLAAIGVSLLARWQLTVFCATLTGLFFVRRLNPYLLLGLLTMAVSVAYSLAQGFLAPVLRSVEASTSIYTEGSGLFERLNDLQNDGWYFVVAPIKAAHLLFSLGLRINNILHPIMIYNDQVIGLFCFVNILFFSTLVIMRKLSPRNDLIMISFVYLIVFALTPVYSPRYFYPVTVLWGFVIAGGWGRIQRPSSPEKLLMESTTVYACQQ
jgi:hypothetical protein